MIEWWDDNGLIPNPNPDPNPDNIRYINGGRYLVFVEITTDQISRTYCCRVTNALVHSTRNSTGSYTLNDLGKLWGGSVMSLHN